MTPWKLECETQGNQMLDFVSALLEQKPKENLAIKRVKIYASIFLVAPAASMLAFIVLKPTMKSGFVFVGTVQVMLLMFLSIYCLQSI